MIRTAPSSAASISRDRGLRGATNCTRLVILLPHAPEVVLSTQVRGDQAPILDPSFSPPTFPPAPSVRAPRLHSLRNNVKRHNARAICLSFPEWNSLAATSRRARPCSSSAGCCDGRAFISISRPRVRPGSIRSRGLLRRAHEPAASSRCAPQYPRTGARDPRLHRPHQPQPEAVRLDQDRRRDPGVHRAVLSANLRDRTLATHDQTCRHYLRIRPVGATGMADEPLHPPSTSQAGPGQKSRFSGRTLVTMKCELSRMVVMAWAYITIPVMPKPDCATIPTPVGKLSKFSDVEFFELVLVAGTDACSSVSPRAILISNSGAS